MRQDGRMSQLEFDRSSPAASMATPLAELLRPASLDEVVGQEALLTEGGYQAHQDSLRVHRELDATWQVRMMTLDDT